MRTGSPISVPRLPTLFEPFDHNDDGSSVTIGLYLARALAVTQGGVIGVEQDGATTVLWARLPLDPASRISTDPGSDPRENPREEDDDEVQARLW